MPNHETWKHLRPDSKKRITLGSLAAGASSFRAHREPDGRIILEPMVEVPAREAWLWQNPAALASVQLGLQEAAQGRLVDRGSFAKFVGEDE